VAVIAMHQHVPDDYTPLSLPLHPVRTPRAATHPASAGVVDAARPSYAIPWAVGAMHQDFHALCAPPSARRVTVRPRREIEGSEPTRPQWDYAVLVDDRPAGVLQLIELEPDLAFVAWVRVDAWARGLGVGAALHRAALADFAALAVEDFASADELRLIDAMARHGHRVTTRTDQSALGIMRHRRVVDRMYVIHRAW
jgi:hypothetical protein